MTTFTFGLCAGRHDLPVSDFIFADGDITFPINPTALNVFGNMCNQTV